LQFIDGIIRAFQKTNLKVGITFGTGQYPLFCNSRENEKLRGKSKKQKVEGYGDFQHSRISFDDTTSPKNISRFKRDHFLASVLVPSVKSDGITT
jgi:hypothetical protein